MLKFYDEHELKKAASKIILNKHSFIFTDLGNEHVRIASHVKPIEKILYYLQSSGVCSQEFVTFSDKGYEVESTEVKTIWTLHDSVKPWAAKRLIDLI